MSALDTAKSLHEFGYAGRFSTVELVTAGLGLAVAMTALTWWQCGPGRRRLLVWLLPLRLLVVGILIWMLAEPTHWTIVRSLRPKAIAILVDASASMSILDRGEEPMQTARWAAFQDAPGEAALVRILDEAAFGLNVARRQLLRLAPLSGDRTESSPDVPTSDNPTEPAVQATRWLRSAVQTLDSLPRSTAFNGVIEQLGPMRRELDQGVRLQMENLFEAMHAEGSDSNEQANDRIGTLTRTLEEMAGKLMGASQAISQHMNPGDDGETRNAVQRELTRNRGQKAAGLLQWLEADVLTQLESQAEVLRYRFDQEVSQSGRSQWEAALALDRGGSAQSTDLTAALAQIERDAATHNLHAVLLLTDGAHNAESDPVRIAAAMGAPPVHIVPVGQVRAPRDVKLHHVQAPRSVFQNDLIVVEAMLDAQDCTGETLQIEMLQDGSVVDRRSLLVNSDPFFSRISLQRKAEHLGVSNLQVRVAPIPGEMSNDNNDADLTVEVTQDVIRVLLADRLPRWEFRFLRNLFDRDERVKPTVLLFNPPRVRDAEGVTPQPSSRAAAGEGTSESGVVQTAGLPDDLESWSRFRVVILGDLAPAQLTPDRQQQLQDFVGLQGGTLVLIAGSGTDAEMPGQYVAGPLAPMLPVETEKTLPHPPEGYRVVFSPEGRDAEVVHFADDPAESEQIWGQPPPLQGVSAFATARQSAHVWLSAVPAVDGSAQNPNPTALLCWQKYGKGRVVYFSSPMTYRLRFRSGDRYHYRFWGQFLRWAVASDIGVGSSTVRMTTDKARYDVRDTVSVTVRLQRVDGRPVEKVSARIVSMSDSKIAAEALLKADTTSKGVYHATLKDLPTGRNRIIVTGPDVEALLKEERYTLPVATEVIVEPDLAPELRDSRCNLPLLSSISAATGGMVVPPTAVPFLLKNLDLRPQSMEEVHQRATWPRWSILTLLIGALAVEWLGRKMVGLV